jgi:hypothetical protein
MIGRHQNLSLWMIQSFQDSIWRLMICHCCAGVWRYSAGFIEEWIFTAIGRVIAYWASASGQPRSSHGKPAQTSRLTVCGSALADTIVVWFMTGEFT